MVRSAIVGREAAILFRDDIKSEGSKIYFISAIVVAETNEGDMLSEGTANRSLRLPPI